METFTPLRLATLDECQQAIFEALQGGRPSGRRSSKEWSDLQVITQHSTNHPACDSHWGSFSRLGGKDADQEEQHAESLATERGQCGETILVVDDIDGVRDLIREVLEMDGYEVLLAEDGQAALQVARQHSGPIHLLLTDVVMPRMGGKDLSDRIHEERPEVRVVFMSGYSDEAISRHGVLQPGAAFLKKPFTSDSLIRCIRQVLDEA